MNTAICPHCLQTKLLSDFSRNRASKTGRQDRCKACCAQATAQWRARHRVQCRAYSRTYHREHRATVLNAKKVYYQQHKARFHAYFQHYRMLNRRILSIKAALYNKQHPEHHHRHQRKWRIEHPGAARYWKYGLPPLSRKQRHAIFLRDRWRCHICHTRVKRSQATIDHIIPISLGGTNVDANLAIAHRSCNSRKQARPFNDQLRLF